MDPSLLQTVQERTTSPPFAPDLSPEVNLLLACARLDLDPGQARRMRTLLQGHLNWEKFFELMLFHRLTALVYRNLSTWAEDLVPEDTLEALRSRFREDGAKALRQVADLMEVLDVLEAGQVLAVPYKGPVLAGRVYGNLAYRYCSDLDILVERRKVMRAAELLVGAGFQPLHPGSSASREFLLRNRYSDIFIRPPVTVVELHWAFTNGDVKFPLGLEDMKSRLEHFEVGGRTLPVFESHDLLLILSVHGMNHCWNRLEWLVGVSELLRTELNWDLVMARAEELKVEKTLYLGLLLANQLLGTTIPRDLLSRIEQDPDVQENASLVRNGLKVEDPFASLRAPDALPRDLFRLRLQRGWRERLRYVLHRLVIPGREDTRLMLPLGSHHVPLPALYRPLRVTAKLVSRIFRLRNRE